MKEYADKLCFKSNVKCFNNVEKSTFQNCEIFKSLLI
jgi:hypothetical protein